jgi:predicted cobalt transporter CbtA
MRRPDGNDSMGGKGRDAVAGSAFQAWRSWRLTSVISAAGGLAWVLIGEEWAEPVLAAVPAAKSHTAGVSRGTSRRTRAMENVVVR